MGRVNALICPKEYATDVSGNLVEKLQNNLLNFFLFFLTPLGFF